MQIIDSACTDTLAHIRYEDNSNILTLTHTNMLQAQRVLCCKVSQRQPNLAAIELTTLLAFCLGLFARF